MKPAVKNFAESALVAIAVAATFFWFLIDATAGVEEVDDPAKITFLAVGLALACAAHIYFMSQAALLDGRSRTLWTVLMVLTFPIASTVLLAKFYLGSRSEAQATTPTAQ